MKKTVLLLAIFTFSALTQAGNGKYRFMIGTYTSKTASEGIYSLEIDIKKDSYKTTLQTSEVTDPSFIATDKQNLYAVNETQNPGFVSAFKFNKNFFVFAIAKSMLCMNSG